MAFFLKKQEKRFLFRINKLYESAVKESFLKTLVESANWYAAPEIKVKVRGESILPDGTPVYVKFWKPRRPLHQIKTIMRSARIEVEGYQYLQFTKNKLPVPDLILWGSRRIPSFAFGIFKVGIVVTRKIVGGANLSTLLRKKAKPWIIRNSWQHLKVLEKSAQLLHSIHKKNLIHGDFKLRNIVFTHTKPNGKYWIIDLASGYSPLSLGKFFNNSHYTRDLFRMVYDLAKKGFSKYDALFFLKAYFCCEKDKNQADMLAKQCLDVCLSQKEPRALEATFFFNQTEFRNPFVFLPPTE